MRHKFSSITPIVIVIAAASLHAQSARMLPAETLLDRAVLKALDEELSGVAAKDHVARLTQLHRVPASPGFHDAIDYLRDHPDIYIHTTGDVVDNIEPTKIKRSALRSASRRRTAHPTHRLLRDCGR